MNRGNNIIRRRLEEQYSELCHSFESCAACPNRKKRDGDIGCDEDGMNNAELRRRVTAMRIAIDRATSTHTE